MPGRVVDMQIGLLLKPPPGRSPKVFQILEVSSIKKIAFDIFKRRLDLSLRLSPALPARNRLAVIMRNEGREGGIEDRPSAFPSEHNRLFVIVEAFPRHSAIILEGILMPSDQGVKVTVYRKVDILPSGEAQDIGEALYLALTGTGEGDRIRAPIHLPLLPGFRFKPYHRFSLRRSQLFEPFPENADPPGIAHFPSVPRRCADP